MFGADPDRRVRFRAGWQFLSCGYAPNFYYVTLLGTERLFENRRIENTLSLMARYSMRKRGRVAFLLLCTAFRLLYHPRAPRLAYSGAEKANKFTNLAGTQRLAIPRR